MSAVLGLQVPPGPRYRRDRLQHPRLPGPVLPLYRALRAVGLDPQRVFKIREAEIDREDVHIWLNDGTIAFTQAVDGHVTGAYFEGDGEVLIRPPDRMERASLGLFINAGVLEEAFSSGLFALQRRHREGAATVSASARGCGRLSSRATMRRRAPWPRWMRCGSAFRSPARRATAAPGEPPPVPDRLLHGRLPASTTVSSTSIFDTRSPEQIVVGNASTHARISFITTCG